MTRVGQQNRLGSKEIKIERTTQGEREDVGEFTEAEQQ